MFDVGCHLSEEACKVLLPSVELVGGLNLELGPLDVVELTGVLVDQVLVDLGFRLEGLDLPTKGGDDVAESFFVGRHVDVGAVGTHGVGYLRLNRDRNKGSKQRVTNRLNHTLKGFTEGIAKGCDSVKPKGSQQGTM